VEEVKGVRVSVNSVDVEKKKKKWYMNVKNVERYLKSRKCVG